MADLEPIDVLAIALRALTECADAPIADDGPAAAREVLTEYDRDELLRIAGCLAHLATWILPPLHRRESSMREVIARYRLELAWRQS